MSGLNTGDRDHTLPPPPGIAKLIGWMIFALAVLGSLITATAAIGGA